MVAVLSVFVSALFSVTVQAGQKVIVSTPFSSENEAINEADWNITDDNIALKNQAVVIASQNATSDTKIISKTSAKASADVKNIASLDATFRITALPGDKRLVFALGLSGIESGLGEEGNIEVFFQNSNGLKVGIDAFSEEGTVQLLAPRSCGAALNSNVTLQIVLTASGTMEAKINNSSLGSFKLPVSGEGRFGILQTGSCGAEITKLSYTCYYYETPENTDIFEDFEKGEFNANLFVSSSNDNGVYPSGVMIEDYNGSKVLRFKNTKLAHFCTLYQYSNFEISFDIPYISRQYSYDEYGNLSGKPCSHLAVGFGEETCTPVGYSYVSDIDLICFTPQVVRSELQKAFRVVIKDMGVTDLSTNEGYSAKLRVVDGHYEVSVKALNAQEYKLIAQTDFDAQRSGYVSIWSSGDGDFAIDNLKITNLDKNPQKIEVEYKSSLLKAEDYVPTKEENEKKFRPAEKTDTSIWKNKSVVLALSFSSAAFVLAGAGLIFYLVRKKKKTGGNDENAEN